MTNPATPPSTDRPPGVLVVDRWIEAMQILTGTADNPTPEQHEEMAAMRRRMLDAVRAAELLEAAKTLERKFGVTPATVELRLMSAKAPLLHATEATDV